MDMLLCTCPEMTHVMQHAWMCMYIKDTTYSNVVNILQCIRLQYILDTLEYIEIYYINKGGYSNLSVPNACTNYMHGGLISLPALVDH